jgi:hypothetical protein
MSQAPEDECRCTVIGAKGERCKRRDLVPSRYADAPKVPTCFVHWHADREKRERRKGR